MAFVPCRCQAVDVAYARIKLKENDLLFLFVEFGNSNRQFFYGPGIDNYDMALRKTSQLKESSSLEFRFETFNTFNHAQFDGANSVDGNIADATFGRILKPQPGRVAQAALKLNF